MFSWWLPLIVCAVMMIYGVLMMLFFDGIHLRLATGVVLITLGGITGIFYLILVPMTPNVSLLRYQHAQLHPGGRLVPTQPTDRRA